MSPRINFDKELVLLKENVTDMANAAMESYKTLFAALERQDEEKIALLKSGDKAISRQQREIESQCLFLITKQHPIVGDLRLVTASLKIVTDIERVADHVTDMAELLLRIHMKDLELFSKHLTPMILATGEMVEHAVEAFVKRDIEGARAVIKADDIIDECFNKVKGELIRSFQQEIKDADECVDVLMLAKYLEKIGDHAVNICEWEIFRETGNMEDMRLL